MNDNIPLRFREYRERARIQCLKWAMGKPYHDPVNNECCPDFSCCVPELFEKDSDSRWEIYRKNYVTERV